jgi:hypothetical protein
MATARSQSKQSPPYVETCLTPSQYMLATRGRGSIRAPLQKLYPSPFSQSRKNTNEVQAESAPSAVTTLVPTIAASNLEKGNRGIAKKRKQMITRTLPQRGKGIPRRQQGTPNSYPH